MGYAGLDIAPGPTNSNRVPTRERARKRCSFWRRNMLLQIRNKVPFLLLHKKAANWSNITRSDAARIVQAPVVDCSGLRAAS
jgi:hypothetical protein